MTIKYPESAIDEKVKFFENLGFKITRNLRRRTLTLLYFTDIKITYFHTVITEEYFCTTSNKEILSEAMDIISDRAFYLGSA